MNAQALRNWGMGVGAAALAAALSIATFSGDPQAPAPAEEDELEKAAPLPPQPVESAALPDAGAEPPVFESASAPPPAAATGPSFIVRFQGSGPLGRAQALAQQGRDADARRAAQAALASQRALRGLCFDRFTLGGAEMVLRPCAAVAASEQIAFRDRWLPRLQSMPGVAYAEVNAIAEPGRTP